MKQQRMKTTVPNLSSVRPPATANKAFETVQFDRFGSMTFERQGVERSKRRSAIVKEKGSFSLICMLRALSDKLLDFAREAERRRID
mmetsp:Transcript_21654/g.32240  ORF Transcript_21654/g.32240 Transcript_21654/m.32240 type:complete len:87 (+) Transcript_21654:605-865(+)